MNLPVRFSPQAEQDLNDTWEYLALSAGPDLADELVLRFEDALAKLAVTPGMGHARTDLGPPQLRFWPVSSYLLVYLPDPEALWVVRILHVRRDVAAVLDSWPQE